MGLSVVISAKRDDVFERIATLISQADNMMCLKVTSAVRLQKAFSTAKLALAPSPFYDVISDIHITCINSGKSHDPRDIRI